MLVDHDGLRHPFGSSESLAPTVSGDDQDVAVAASGMPRTEPAVAVDPRDPRRVVVATVDYDVPSGTRAYGPVLGYPPRADVFSSVDGGRTFRGPVVWPLGTGATLSGDPSLASDAAGRVYLSYAEYGPTGSRGAGGIYVARSLDGGRTWDRRLARLAADSLSSSAGKCHFHDKDEVAVDPRRGDVYVAWSDYEYDGSASCGAGTGPVLLARSTDHGRHFSRVLVSDEADSTVGAMPRVARDGTVYVAYTRYRFTDQCTRELSYGVTIVVARSTDHGRTFASREATPLQCMPDNPNLTLGTYRTRTFPSFDVLPDGTLVLSTVVQVGQHSELTVVRSRDGGSTWRSVGTPLMSPVGQYQFPRLAVGPGGVVVLTYIEQLPGGVFSCLISSSSDGATTWTSPVTVSSERSFGSNGQFQGGYDGDYIGLAIGPDRVAHPAWTDVRVPGPGPVVGGENVWTRRVRL